MAKDSIIPKVVEADTIETCEFGKRIPIKALLAGLKEGQGIILPAKRKSYIKKAYPEYTIKATVEGGILVYKK